MSKIYDVNGVEYETDSKKSTKKHNPDGLCAACRKAKQEEEPLEPIDDEPVGPTDEDIEENDNTSDTSSPSTNAPDDSKDESGPADCLTCPLKMDCGKDSCSFSQDEVDTLSEMEDIKVNGMLPDVETLRKELKKRR